MLDLPFPPSVNRIWRSARSKKPGGKPQHFLDAKYKAWKTACDEKFWVAGWARGWAKEGIHTPIRTPIDVAITLDRSKRRGDTDNRIKPCLDWLQRSGVIANDSQVENVSAGWGEAPDGVRIAISAAESVRVELARLGQEQDPISASRILHEETNGEG